MCIPDTSGVAMPVLAFSVGVTGMSAPGVGARVVSETVTAVACWKQVLLDLNSRLHEINTV